MSLDSSQNNKRIAKNTLLLYFRMLLTMGISLYTSRVVLKALGVEDFGIYNVVAGVVTSLAFLNTSLNTASSRYITVSLGKDDFSSRKRIFAAVLVINMILGAIILILSETIGLWFVLNQLNIPESRVNAAIWVFQISIIAIILNILSVPFNATIIAHERMKAFAYISLIDAVAKLGIAYFICYDFKVDRLIIYSLLLLLVHLIDQIIYMFYCIKKFEEINFKLSFDCGLMKEILTFISWSAYGSFVSIGFTQGLNILLNIYFGPSINAARGIAVQVQTAIYQFTYNFLLAVNPQLIKSVVQKEFDRSKFLLIACSKLSFFLLCIIGIPVICCAEFILNLWLEEVPSHTVNFLRIIVIISMVQALASPLRIINQAEGNIKRFQMYECTTLLCIVPISYLALSFGMKPEIVFVIHLFVELVAHYIRIKIVLPKIVMPIHEYVQYVLLRTVPVLLISLLIVWQIHNNIIVTIFDGCIILLLSAFIVAITILLVGLNRKERLFIYSKLIILSNKFQNK